MNGNLRNIVDEKSGLENRVRNLQQENDSLRKGTNDTEFKVNQAVQ